jgi:hypothetical protein
MSDTEWPALPLDGWKDTCSTMHLWSQIVGKVALAHAHPLNHCWGIALQPTPRGLSTRLLRHGERSFAIEMDFLDHRLVVSASNGDIGSFALQPRSVADFYRTTMKLLDDMALPVRIWPVSVELPEPIRLDQDEEHASYDPEAVGRFWRVLQSSIHVLSDTCWGFVGKTSPVHFFWGSFDLAVTRFSGRPAPPREGPAFQREAYSHEVISHGFWPGSAFVPEPAFYAYAAPEPAGLREVRLQPEGVYYQEDFKIFILPYELVRTSGAPERAVRAFVDSTYDAAATLAKWDRAALDRPRAS